MLKFNNYKVKQMNLILYNKIWNKIDFNNSNNIKNNKTN